MTSLHHVIPDQKTGWKTGARARVHYSSEMAAMNLYRIAVRRLMAINRWGGLSGVSDEAFMLTDDSGNPLDRPHPETGDLIRIRLPAPRNKTGGGYDWVQVEQITSDAGAQYESTAIRVRPVPAPGPGENTAHFYTRQATSTFCVYRKGKTVWAMEFGRNEVANTKVPFLTALRNMMIVIGARMGLARLQWNSLMKGILGKH